MNTPANRRKLLTGLLPILAVGGLLLAARTSFAGHIEGNVCLGTLYTNLTGKTLGCSANDVKIAKTTQVSPSSCEDGTLVPTLQATFQVVLSSGSTKNQTRYDLGLYFDINGDPEKDGARGGTCSLNSIQSTDSGFIDLDGDDCGDINATNNNLFPTFTFHNVFCSDPDKDGLLNLPNCVSWRQPGSNDVCSDSLFTQDPFVGEPLTPGTSSKCKCDDMFNIPVTVTPARGAVKKNPTQALVTYGVSVKNLGAHPANLTSLNDDTYGNIADSSNSNLQSTTCAVPQNNLAVNAEYTCEFTVLVSAPGSSDPVTDHVTGMLVDTVNGTTSSPVGSASVTVYLPQSQ